MTTQTKLEVGQEINLSYEMTHSYSSNYEITQDDLDIMAKEKLDLASYCKKYICSDNPDCIGWGIENRCPVDDLEIEIDGKSVIREPKTIVVAHFFFDYCEQWIEKIDDTSYKALEKVLKKYFEWSDALDDEGRAKALQELKEECSTKMMMDNLIGSLTGLKTTITITIESLELEIFIKRIYT